MSIEQLRREYHQSICREIVFIDRQGIPNVADKSNQSSRRIAQNIFQQIASPTRQEEIAPQTVGRLFESITARFLEQAFAYLSHMRPGKWIFIVEQHAISSFEQYEHLALIQRTIEQDPQLKTALGGDYLITPDIVIARHPISDDELNRHSLVVNTKDAAGLTPLRQSNQNSPLLHASISCKWTIRSDRAQNTRAEALNLIRNRKGRTPHIAVVVAEPLPSRLASLTLGTGDIDCTYHFALPELLTAVKSVSEDLQDMLQAMVEGRRLRDISDLPFDLAI